MSDPRLDQLREGMSELEAPRRVEAAVMAEFRARREQRSNTAWFRWVLAAAALVLVVGAVLWRSKEGEKPVQVVTAPPPVSPAREVAPPPPAPQPAPVRQARRSRPKRQAAAPPPAEVASDFISLPYAPPLYADDGGQVVRVRLPRSAMRSVGLPVLEERAFERVPADVLLGQDGIARAVRFVSVAQ